MLIPFVLIQLKKQIVSKVIFPSHHKIALRQGAILLTLKIPTSFY